MTRLFVVGALAVGLVLGAVPARAHDHYDDSQSHPLRLAAYAVHPAGWAFEWLVTKPVHFLVSQKELESIFGHHPHESPYGEYRAYQSDDPER